MTLTSKILFTIPTVIQVFFIMTFAFPTSFSWLYPDMTTYHILMIIHGIFQFSIVAILIGKVWKMNDFSRKQKWNWTWFLVFMGNIAVLFFVWGKTKNLDNEEEEVLSTTSQTTED